MSENMEAIKRKIEALLAKGNDTAATEEEADAFNRKANELMVKYNIERAELGAEEEVERFHMTLQVQLRPWSQYALHGITKLYFCNSFSVKLDSKGRKHEVTLVGEKQNVMVCHAIAVMVLRSIQTEARRHQDGRSFMTGAGHRVYERCQEMMEYSRRTPTLEQTKQLSAPGSNALVVLAEQEQEGNSDYIEQTLGIKLVTRQARGPKVNDAGAYHRGREHGDKVQLRRNLLGSG